MSNGIGHLSYWEELPCGIYSVHVEASSSNQELIGEVRRHEYTNSMLKELIKWERTSIEPKPEDLASQYKPFRKQHNVHSTPLEADPSETGNYLIIVYSIQLSLL